MIANSPYFLLNTNAARHLSSYSELLTIRSMASLLELDPDMIVESQIQTW